MPFKSEKQRKFLYANEPEVAKKFAEDNPMSAREPDVNGWYEIKDNPLSKVGVYDYMGSTIDPSGELGLDPAKAYSVYRPAEELSSPETLESFKLLPWIDEHEMLGNSGNMLTPPEQKGIEGIIGEDIYFKDGYLLGNIKLFSEELAKKVDAGKKELSCGYRCEYLPEGGIFGDQEYQFTQRKIRGNHLASVPEGRMGHDVAVLDHKLTFTIDSEEFKLMDAKDETENKEGEGNDEMTLGEVTTMLKTIMPQIQTLMDAMAGNAGGEPGDEGYDSDEDRDLGLDADEDKDKDKEAKGEDEKVDNEKLKSTVDALDTQVKGLTTELEAVKKGGLKTLMQEVSKRDSLYSQVSEFTGAFDHKEMTVTELAVYACDKLELADVEKGHEVSVLTGYLANRAKPTAFAVDGLLSGGAPNTKAVDDYFKKAS